MGLHPVLALFRLLRYTNAESQKKKKNPQGPEGLTRNFPFYMVAIQQTRRRNSAAS